MMRHCFERNQSLPTPRPPKAQSAWIRILCVAFALMALCASRAVVAVERESAATEANEEAKDEAAKDEAVGFYDPEIIKIEGWTVKVDPLLLKEEHRDVREKAFSALANHLQRVALIMNADKLEQVRALPIWIELNNSRIGGMQYHPGRGWLEKNGYDPRLVKHVHIPKARELYNPRTWAKHPYVVLHELAHAYHDQVLDFDNPEIEATYEAAKADGRYEEVLLYTGKRVRHYGLNNPKEYFAESTEAYFGVNDFYPFVRAELREHDPRMFQMMEKFWGPIAE